MQDESKLEEIKRILVEELEVYIKRVTEDDSKDAPAMWPQLPKRFHVNNFLALRRVLSSPYTHSGNIDKPDALRKRISEVL